MTVLSRAALRGAAPPAPGSIAVLHIGPGAFHRAHQAWYFDRALDADPRWGISALALRSAGTIDALRRQDGLYTLVTLGEKTAHRLIRAHAEWLYAGRADDAARALRRFADPALQLVTLTVTEKGYCLDADGALDLQHPDIAADLAQPAAPRSAIGWIVAGLAQRRASGGGPLTVISCDNRRGNGQRLGAAVLALAQQRCPELAAWIRADITFPDSMVDAITPASTPALLEAVAAQHGLRDEAAVQREEFCQWVIEDRFASQRPDLAALGVTLTDDVAAFERAKLRILNGAHSTLAYLGLARGHATVLDAMRDAELATHVERMLVEEVLPGLAGDLGPYLQATFTRFRNAALRHELAQIAWDGSQKLPYRIVDGIAENIAAGRPVTRLAGTLAAWFLFLRSAAGAGRDVIDPRAPELVALAAQATGEPGHDTKLLLGVRAVIGAELAGAQALRDALRRSFEALGAARLPSA